MEDYSPYMPWIAMAVNGLVAGWLASLLLGGGGIIRDIFVGIIGAFVGGALVQAGLLKLPFLLDMAVGAPDPRLDHRRHAHHHHRPHHRPLAGRQKRRFAPRPRGPTMAASRGRSFAT